MADKIKPIGKKVAGSISPERQKAIDSMEATKMARKVEDDNDWEKAARMSAYGTNKDVRNDATIKANKAAEYEKREVIANDSTTNSRANESRAVRDLSSSVTSDEDYNKASRTKYDKEVDEIFDNEPNLVAMPAKERNIVVEGKIAQKRKAMNSKVRADSTYSMGGGR